MTENPTREELLEKVKELQQSLESYRTLIDKTQDLLYRTDLEGRISFISPSVYRLSGYTVEEAIGLHMGEEVYFSPEERNDFLAKLRDEGQVSNFEARLKRKDGSIWWASTNAHFYKDLNGTILGVEGITRDITPRKLVEEELRASEKTFRTALDALHFRLQLWNVQDDKIFFWSRSAQKLFGHTAPTASEWYKIAYPDPHYRKQVIERWKPFLVIAHKSGLPVNTGQYQVTCRIGSVRICELFLQHFSGPPYCCI